MNYNINDKFLIDEVIFDDGAKNYRIIGTEAPIVTKISNLKVRNKNEDCNYNYEYGIGFAFDKEEPKYNSDLDSEPYNIERDGQMWHIRANNGNNVKLDQNAKARYQIYLKKAKNMISFLKYNKMNIPLRKIKKIPLPIKLSINW